MYDSSSLELIENGPVFGDLDLELLPKEFTDVYTKIISEKIRLDNNQLDKEELLSIYHEMNRVAVTYESYVSIFGNNRENLSSAAFIAATCHRLNHHIISLLGEDFTEEFLGDSYMEPIVLAGILFLMSGYTADASECSKLIIISPDDEFTGKGRLLKALLCLLAGSIGNVFHNIPVYSSEGVGDDRVSDSLWGKIHRGLNSVLLSISYLEYFENDEIDRAKSTFREVLSLCSDFELITIDERDVRLGVNFPGQQHLARLLLSLSEIIPDMSILSSAVPNGVSKDSWMETVAGFSKVRPYLWPNHREAIASGYLDKGVSSVVSFPTGGGKSTLSELKISTALSRGEAVVFLVPTLALVDQVAKSLRAAFPAVKTTISLDELGLEDIELVELPDISVMTPESCLVRMSFNPDSFSKVGLFIFDECHLIHPSDNEADRRNIDAMLSLIRITDLADDLDIILMSAMIQNNEELAGWIGTLINKPVLALNVGWKPTRQAKGCVVYSSSRIDELYESIPNATRTPGGRLTAGAKRDLTAKPYSFFSLNQTWHSNSAADYKLVKLTEEEINLGINDFDGLTANRNEVAAHLASYSSGNGIKTLIFSADKRGCDSIVNKSAFDRQGEISFTDEELELRRLIELEFGGQYSYVGPDSTALPHHGLLIKEERRLHETLFCRENGIDLIVATSTIAQGINLPAEFVIIAGNTRFDADTERQEKLDAHELLNAAGRAGRAGSNANGVVLVIPSRVIGFNSDENRITQYWREIQEVFTNQDQCLNIEDPLEVLLNDLNNQGEDYNDEVKYFINRLPVHDNSVNESSGFIKKTFGAYKAMQRDDVNWVSIRENEIAVAHEAIRGECAEDEGGGWYQTLATATGINPQVLQDLHQDSIPIFDLNQLPHEILEWYLQWVTVDFNRAAQIFRFETFDMNFGAPFCQLEEQDKLAFIQSELFAYTQLWMQGATMSDLERAFGVDDNRLNKCESARKFVIRVVPEIAYAASILAQIHHHHLVETGAKESYLNLELLNECIRFGYDQPYKLALSRIVDSESIRVMNHQLAPLVLPFVDGLDEETDFNRMIGKVRSGYLQWSQTQ